MLFFPSCFFFRNVNNKLYNDLMLCVFGFFFFLSVCPFYFDWLGFTCLDLSWLGLLLDRFG